jgi:hypothetical protein
MDLIPAIADLPKIAAFGVAQWSHHPIIHDEEIDVV